MTGKSRLQKTEEDVQEVTVIMLDNYHKAQENTDKLEDLEKQAEELKEKGKVFEKTTRTLMEQEKGGKNKKKIISVIVGVVVAIIVGVIVFFAL